MVRDALSMRGNPFYNDAERALYVARRGKQTVGRIAAVENRWHNRYHKDRLGFFGFFECLEDQEAATELFASAEHWLKVRGLKASRGPISPSMNHECGLLINGFGAPPVIMTPWNPPYYADLIEGAGYAKIQDLLGYYIPAGNKLAVPDRVRHLAERTRRRLGITFRRLDASTLKREARKIHGLYKNAWDGNWGFVPPSWDERLAVVFELDTDPLFAGHFFQGSSETPVFFETYWRDLRYTGNKKDDDHDGRIDEEYLNQKDDDGDGFIDEDLHHPIRGEKWPILVLGAVFGLGFYAILGIFGMPMFFIWGYIRAVASAGAATFFTLITEVIGALLAKYYFWPRYGTQQWRQYAMVLAVGFGVGISLVGMVCASVLMVSKGVSPTSF